LKKILQSKGKKMLAGTKFWKRPGPSNGNELAQQMMRGGITAAVNHHVVMTPWDYIYR